MAANHAFRSIISEYIRNRVVVSVFVSSVYSMQVFCSHDIDQIITSVQSLHFCSIVLYLFLYSRLSHLISSQSSLSSLLNLDSSWFHSLLWRHCWICVVSMDHLLQCDSSICLSIFWILSLAQTVMYFWYILNLQLSCILCAMHK